MKRTADTEIYTNACIKTDLDGTVSVCKITLCAGIYFLKKSAQYS